MLAATCGCRSMSSTDVLCHRATRDRPACAQQCMLMQPAQLYLSCGRHCWTPARRTATSRPLLLSSTPSCGPRCWTPGRRTAASLSSANHLSALPHPQPTSSTHLRYLLEANFDVWMYANRLYAGCSAGRGTCTAARHPYPASQCIHLADQACLGLHLAQLAAQQGTRGCR